MNWTKRYTIELTTREKDGSESKVRVPLGYAYGLAGAAVVGLFTISGLLGSYSRMLIKTERFNQLRTEHSNLQRDYAHLEHSAKEREVQVSSLGGLATEVSALYGMTASKLALPAERVTELARGRRGKKGEDGVVKGAVNAPLVAENAVSDAGYYKSLEKFYTLRTEALNGGAAKFLPGTAVPALGVGSSLAGTSLTRVPGVDTAFNTAGAPQLWPVLGPITSGFGQRVDPVLGTGEGEFHKGIDIAAPQGTPIRATAAGLVLTAGLGNGYGREVVIDHGHGLKTLYGHMSGFNVIAGQTVFAGQIIGYVGHSGRTTGNHVHYEVKIHDIAVNPHKYLRVTTVAGLEPKGTGGAGS